MRIGLAISLACSEGEHSDCLKLARMPVSQALVPCQCSCHDREDHENATESRGEHPDQGDCPERV